MARSRPLPKWPTRSLERKLGGVVCGVDEAGCAPLAGPVVAAAVVLPDGPKPRRLRGLTDSKLLSAGQRERLCAVIHDIADVGVGLASVEEIDRCNILQADLRAMQRAVAALKARPDHALVDGRNAPSLPCPVHTVIKGDRRSLSIAAASVVAKVHRDRTMRRLADAFPAYGWEQNAGYGTPAHYLGLLCKGPSKHHRRSFAPLTTLFGPGGSALADYCFGYRRGRPDLERVELLMLRRDLHAVFDAHARHLGVVRNLGGRWTFQSVAFDATGRTEIGAGPCAAHHGRRLARPDPDLLARVLRGR